MLFLLRQSLPQLFRFGVVGVSSTLIHIGIASSLITFLAATQVIANCSAFACSAIFSYLAHTKWSFASSITKKTITKFIIVTTICFTVTAIISSIAQYFKLPYQIGILLIVSIVPILSYFLHRFWTYKKIITN